MKARSRTHAARCGALVLGVLLSAALPRGALAQSSSADVETARALFVEATRLGTEGRWTEARDLYARSLQLKSAPLTRYSLGVAQRETGSDADALASFRSFLAAPAKQETAAFVGPARTAVAELELRVGRVIIALEPASIEGVTLLIDGQPVPPAPQGAREVDPGAHEVVARAPGFHPASGRFVVLAGGSTSLTLTLSSDGSTPASAGPRQSPAPPERAAVVAPASSTPVLPIVLMSVGGVTFLSGAILGAVGLSDASDATRGDSSDASAARAKGVAGDVIAGAGLACAGVGLVMLLTRGRPTAPATAAVRPWSSGPVSGFKVRF